MARSTYFDLGRSADARPGSESGYAQRFQCGNVVKRLIWTGMFCPTPAKTVRRAVRLAKSQDAIRHIVSSEACDFEFRPNASGEIPWQIENNLSKAMLVGKIVVS